MYRANAIVLQTRAEVPHNWYCLYEVYYNLICVKSQNRGFTNLGIAANQTTQTGHRTVGEVGSIL